jgi:hypothetical protein
MATPIQQKFYQSAQSGDTSIKPSMWGKPSEHSGEQNMTLLLLSNHP